MGTIAPLSGSGFPSARTFPCRRGRSPSAPSEPSIEIVGNGLTYNRENAAPTAAFFDVGDTWTESTPTFTQLTVTLKIMGGDADIDGTWVVRRCDRCRRRRLCRARVGELHDEPCERRWPRRLTVDQATVTGR
jgi:hypothetical protein